MRRRIAAKTCASALLVVASFAASTGSLPSVSADAVHDVCGGKVAGVDLQSATIPDLQEALSAGVLTSVDLVDAYLARIAAYDGQLNSIRTLNPRARDTAAHLDALRASGQVLGPLHGIPVLLKDNIGTNDMPTTAGSIALRGNVPEDDSAVAARLREAGAIILGKTNLTEFANWVSLSLPDGYSSLGGQVLSAYTLGTPSGSSAGSGVAASMAFAAATVGTETQGSILSPSHINSVVGVRPTHGTVPGQGIIPLSPNFDVAGPMTRNVVDSALLLETMATDAPPGSSFLANLEADALEGARIGYDPDLNYGIYGSGLIRLAQLGAILIDVRAMYYSDLVHAGQLSVFPNDFKASLNAYLATEAGPETEVHTLTEVIEFNRQHPQQMRYGQNLLQASDATPGDRWLADRHSTPIKAKADAYLTAMMTTNRLDAIVTPGHEFPMAGAAAGFPAVGFQIGYEDGVPRGMAFTGARDSEPMLLSYAYAFERSAGVRRTPTEMNPGLVCAARARALGARQSSAWSPLVGDPTPGWAE